MTKTRGLFYHTQLQLQRNPTKYGERETVAADGGTVLGGVQYDHMSDMRHHLATRLQPCTVHALIHDWRIAVLQGMSACQTRWPMAFIFFPLNVANWRTYSVRVSDRMTTIGVAIIL